MRRLALSATLILLLIISCTKKNFITGDTLPLRFSVDTVYFDTVFSTLGTATRELRVTNPNSDWIKIDRITTSNPDSSPFRLNIDGEPGNSRENIEIAPGDSLFIFVDAIIDPSNQDNPIAVIDSILFFYGSQEQDVNIMAWGQDIELINGDEIVTDTWSGSKPYVVYNSMMVDTMETLTIEEGVRVLFHRGSTMYIAGTLVVNGTLDKPVIFSSDRYEKVYEDIPGQWNGIYFQNGSESNSINYALIRNAVSALHLGNLDSPDQAPDLNISNSIIMHNTVSGISSLGAIIDVQNCVISHCGYYSLFLAMGGTYSFLHCTIDNFWEYSVRTGPGVLISDYFEYDQEILSNTPVVASFVNSVISGSLNNEVGVYSLGEQEFNCSFNSCLLRIDTEDEMWESYDFENNLLNLSPRFIEGGAFDYRPDTLSPLIDAADPAFSISLDLDIRKYSRFADSGPDIGAYERQIGEKSE